MVWRRERSEVGFDNQPAMVSGRWKGENFTRAGLCIAAVGEARDDAGALIDERQRFLVVHPFERGGRIAPRLLLDRCNLVAPVIGFSLDHTNRFRGNEKDIVS